MNADSGTNVFNYYTSNDSTGKEFLAIFDIDETLINTKSMFAFLQYFYKKKLGSYHGEINYHLKCTEIKKMQKTACREEINRHFYRYFQGERLAELTTYAQGWFQQASQEEGFFLGASGRLLATLRQQGARIVFLSGSADFIVRPIVTALGGGDILAVSLQEVDSIVTGEIAGIQTIGAGKRTALEKFLQLHSLSMAGAWACGDHTSDLPFLEMAEFPCVVAGSAEMENIARNNRWPILDNDLSMEISL